MNVRSPVEDCAYAKLRRLTRCVAHHFDTELAPSKLKATQHGVLTAVLRLQPVCPGELAQALGIDPSTLTRNLKPLVAARWLELGAGADARSRTVRITATGRDKQAEAQLRLRVAQRVMNEKLGARRMADLRALMDECMDILAIQS
ncbi:MarR family winged helix-turn-helix transcriptional regulator [Variovorax paradoxus]|jgi:DNA-binding MarR family transcriptional regulator|uniref:MarR family winged helix-turn-helix transcriptional regulator n=1 Tax=Variovorax paradoxus TaxID=34073 RepID=UPI003AADA59F